MEALHAYYYFIFWQHNRIKKQFAKTLALPNPCGHVLVRAKKELNKPASSRVCTKLAFRQIPPPLVLFQKKMGGACTGAMSPTPYYADF